MNDLRALLESIGFSHHESAVYLRLLEAGEQPASAIARAAHLPRSTVRNALDRLCERAVVCKVCKRSTQYYSCKSPESLVDHLRRRARETEESAGKMQEALPVFAAMHAKKNVVPKVRVFEGPHQVIEAFNRCLYCDPPIHELLIFTSYDFLQNPPIRKNDDEFFIGMRVKRGIRARVLVGRTSESGKLVTKAPKELRERRFIPADVRLPGNIHVYGDCVMYFSASDGEYLAVLTESAMMADTMRALFEFMWNRCA